jgi:NAD-dependent SIR2 family protein deacetylase
MALEEQILKSVKAIQEADVFIITAGAGIGVDSGLPDFRGKNGLYRVQENQTKQKDFVNNPQEAWYYYGNRFNLYQATIPHQGFYQLLEIARQKKDYYIYTSNIDEHFQKAGFDTNKIEECHGSLFNWQCCVDCQGKIWRADCQEIKINEQSKEADTFPICRDCGKPARPNVMMFGDRHWNPIFSKNQGVENNYRLKDLENKGYKFVIVEIGAGLAVPTVRREGEKLAQKYKTTLIRINPNDTFIEDKHISIALNAKEAIQAIYQMICF